MGTTSGYITRNQDLIINMDAANSRSYTSGSTKCECLVSTVEGVLENGTSFSPEYKGGWTFDGTNDYLNLGDRANINPGLDSFTCNIFFKIDPSSNDSNIIASKGNNSSGDIGWMIYYHSINEALTVRCNGNDAVSQRAGQHIPINKGQVYMVTLVINRTDNTIKGYLNGSNSGWINGNYNGVFTGNSISGFGSITNSDDFLIGERPYLNLPMIGTIYLFQTYNFALSEAQVYRNFRFFGGRYDLSVPPPPPSFFNDYSFEFDVVGSDITLSYWVNCNGTYAFHTAYFPVTIPRSDSSDNNNQLGRISLRGANCYVSMQSYDENNANFSNYYCRSVELKDTGWHNIVLTWNNTTKHLYCYIDSVVQTWSNFGNTVTTPFLNYITTPSATLFEHTLRMGRGLNGTTYFGGLVDEVATFDSVLSSVDITSIYNSGTPTDLTFLSPYGWWRNGDNSLYKDPQWLLPSNENKDKVSNYSMSLDGTNDYMVTSPFSTLDGATYLSMSFWVKLDSLSTTQTFIKSTEDVHSYQTNIYVTSSGMIQANIANNGANWTRSATGAITVGNWHHVVVTLDNTINRYLKLKIFVDGTQSVGGSNFYNAVIGNGVDLYVGSSDTPSLFLDGNIDEVSIWGTHTLTPSEISTLYNNGTPTNLDDFSTPPQNWWRMGENATFKDPQWLLPSNENKDKISNYSMSFDGTDDGFLMAADSALTLSGAFSISIWMKGTVSSNCYLFSRQFMYVQHTGVNKIRMRTFENGGSYQTVETGTVNIYDDNWHHILITYQIGGNASIYLDGVLKTNPVVTQLGFVGGAIPIGIGTDYLGSGSFFTGQIDDIAFWHNTDVSSSVSTIYNGGTPNDLTSLSPSVWLKAGDDATYNFSTSGWTMTNNGTTGIYDAESINMDIYDRVGESPGSSGNTVSYNMDINDRVGDAPNSENNALSYNMVLSGRTTDVPT